MRNVYHLQNVTGLDELRKDAQVRHLIDGELTMIHHHAHDTSCFNRGCEVAPDLGPEPATTAGSE